MNKSVSKIKDVIKLNSPTFNKKYNVWVVRMKLKTGWKAVWRKQKDDANEVYEYLTKKIITEDVEKNVNSRVEIIEEQKTIQENTKETPKPIKGNVLMRMLSKTKEVDKKVEQEEVAK